LLYAAAAAAADEVDGINSLSVYKLGIGSLPLFIG
jgi:hypothetical protein